MSHTIELKKVSKYYANDNSVSLGFGRLDLTLDMGEFVAITGESGSGKSTLLNVISGLDNYDEGEMFVCGEDTTAYSTEDYERYRKRYIGNIFQDFNLVNSYTVYQNIELVMLLCGKKADECGDRIAELLEIVGLTDYAKEKASRLSGGQKQRVAIARALAKDAPIIVADEPTGNLDSESAAIVMRTLKEVSSEKLVLIVTHNYEQAEEYVTRKLTMHDGRIIEDKKIASIPADTTAKAEESEEQVESAEGIDNEMKLGSQLRLGLRNSFNLPGKFALLLIVYLFVASAVLSQYASVKSNQYETSVLGYNMYFIEQDASRVILKKQDGTAFTDEDAAAIKKLDNVEYLVRNDLALDSGSIVKLADANIYVTSYSTGQISKAELDYGSMPQNDNEIVLYCNSQNQNYEYVKGNSETLIGTAVALCDESDDSRRLIAQDVIISGIILDEGTDLISMGYDKIYISDALSAALVPSQLATRSKTTIDYNGKKFSQTGFQLVYPSANVAQGEAFISESGSYYYENASAKGKALNISAKTRYFDDTLQLTVAKVFDADNIESLLGYSKDNYDMYSSYVYINPDDFNRLYNKGNYQMSVFVKDENECDELVSALNKKGYSTLPVRDTLTDITGGFDFVIELLQGAKLLLEIIVLFFIAYAVIKLIMKSRNSYYSSLRILGASRGNTDRILRVELLVMMTIAYAIDIILVLLIKNGVIKYETLANQVGYLKITDYVILFVLLLIMSLLIARRYSRKIFSKSAMNSYRGEV